MDKCRANLSYHFIFKHSIAFRDFFIPKGWGKKVEYKTRYYQMGPALAKTKVMKTGRGIGKSLDVEFSLLQHGILKHNEETVLSSFRRVHIKDRCEAIIKYCLRIPYLHKFIDWKSVNRTPIYKIPFKNGHVIYGASVGEDPNATSILGKHPSTRAIDEMQVYPRAAWVQFNEARAEDGSDDIYVGVPNGIIGMPFTDIQKNPIYRANFFRIPRWVNPFWTQARKEDAIIRYGGEDSDEYKQQILGEDGSPVQSAWDIEKIAAQAYTRIPKYVVDITPQDYEGRVPEELLFDLPTVPGNVILGIDAGYTAPTVILIFEDGDKFTLHGRVVLKNKVIFDDQEEIIDYIMEFYQATMGLDVTSAEGREISDALKNPKNAKYNTKDYESRITDVYFNKKVVKGFTSEGEEIEEEIKVYTSLILIKMFAGMKFNLPKDEKILEEFSQEVKRRTTAGRIVYGTSGTDHIISAFRCFALAKFMQTAPQFRKRVGYALPEWGTGRSYGN